MTKKQTNLIHCSAVALALIGCEPGVSQVNDDDVVAADTETSEADTEEEETDTDTETDTFMFVPEDIIVPPGDCDPFAQDCADGEKCVPYSSADETWDANQCVPVTGDGQPGDTCTSGGASVGTDDCGPESICWDTKDVDGVLVGACTPFCGGSANDPICEPQTSCVIANEGSITLCIATCDPLLQDCADGLGCFWANEDFNCVFTTDELPSNEPCGYINDCAPGNYCADASALPSCNGAACCAPYCDLVSPTCSLAETECITFFEEGLAPPGYEDVGICILPG